jgi:hypothetical protein
VTRRGELGPVIQEPIQVEEPLVDDVLVEGALVLDDDRAAVLVETEGVDPSAVAATGGVVRGDQVHAEQCLQVALDQGVERALDRHRRAGEFDDAGGEDAEEPEIAHGSTDTSAGWERKRNIRASMVARRSAGQRDGARTVGSERGRRFTKRRGIRLPPNRTPCS